MKQVSLTDNRHKIYSGNSGKTYQLYDLVEDRAEKNDIADRHPEIVARMRETLEDWRESCRKSSEGEDY